MMCKGRMMCTHAVLSFILCACSTMRLAELSEPELLNRLHHFHCSTDYLTMMDGCTSDETKERETLSDAFWKKTGENMAAAPECAREMHFPPDFKTRYHIALDDPDGDIKLIHWYGATLTNTDSGCARQLCEWRNRVMPGRPNEWCEQAKASAEGAS